MEPRVFSKAGDSNFAAFDAIYGLGCREPSWGDQGELEPVLRRYRETPVPGGLPIPGDGPSEPCAPANSFSRVSAATMSGITTAGLLRPLSGLEGRAECAPGESMLACEIRVARPRYVFLNVGTNDIAFDIDPEGIGERVGAVIAEIERLGPVPVVLTIPPLIDTEGSDGRWGRAVEANRAIAGAAHEAEVPLLDQWLALTRPGMVFKGLRTGDGTHLETPGGSEAPGALQRSVDFSDRGLRYGNNLRNLLILRTLRLLDAALAGRLGG